MNTSHGSNSFYIDPPANRAGEYAGQSGVGVMNNYSITVGAIELRYDGMWVQGDARADEWDIHSPTGAYHMSSIEYLLTDVYTNIVIRMRSVHCSYPFAQVRP
jgi:hypothetical protein